MEIFAALADPTRWRVLNLLAERGEATATTLALAAIKAPGRGRRLVCDAYARP
jgi:hypothetical protein